MGIFNHLFDFLKTLLESVENPTVKASDWSDGLSVTPDGQGDAFNGNSVAKLLRGIDSLEDMLTDHPLEELCTPIVEAFRHFKELTDLCFGQDLLPGWALALDRFMEVYRTIEDQNGKKISVSVKVHIIEAHLADFFERQKALGNGGKGLGFYAKQAFKAGHYDWKHLWVDRKYVRDMSHPDYDSQLKKCGVTYNSRHTTSPK